MKIEYFSNNFWNNFHHVSWIAGLFLMFACVPISIQAQTRLDDSLSLVEFYNTTNGSLGWNLNQPIDTWAGVSVTNNRVDAMYISEYGISGFLVDFNLTEIKILSLVENQLAGPIPDFSNLPKLERLYLNHNLLSGTIPDFSNLPNLNTFAAAGNQLIGSIPDFSNLPGLTTISIDINQLSGPIPDYSNIPNLEYMRLSDNQLQGTIPLFTNLPNLESVYLTGNQLSGPIPKFVNSPNLTSLWLRGNQYTFPEVINSFTYNDSIINSNSGNYNFSLQDSIPIYSSANKYFVIAGGKTLDNTYDWYKDDTFFASITGDSLFVPSTAGFYHCEVTNSQLPGLTLTSKSTFLLSDSIVYPGDANRNGKVEASDVLYCGISYNNTGPIRPNANSSWTPQNCANWATEIAEINSKHQDCDGNGIVDDNDLTVIGDNYNQTSPAYLPGAGSEVSSYYLDLIPVADSLISIQGVSHLQRKFDIYLRHKDGDTASVSARGISFTISNSNSVNMYSDTDNSSLGNQSDLRRLEKYDTTSRKLDVGIFTLLPDQQLTGPVASIIMEELLLGIDPTESKLLGPSNILRNDSLEKTSYQTIMSPQPTFPSNFANTSTVMASVSTIDPDCRYLGRANVYVQDAGQYLSVGPYTYEWSTGETASSISNLAPGTYSLTVSSLDPAENPAIINFELSSPEGCPNAVILTPKLWLEGAIDLSTGLMNDQLRAKSLIPPSNPFSINDSLGEFVFQNTGSHSVVDWLKVELYTTEDPARLVNQCYALLRRNGEVVALDGFSSVEMATIGQDSLYVVFSHRNHLPVVYGPVAPGNVVMDLTSENGVFSGTNISQKQVLPNRWALFAGDINRDLTIDGIDKQNWSHDNGNFDLYLNADLNLDGEVNGVDKIIWSTNNGIFITLP